MTFRLAAIVSVDLLGYSGASEINEDAAFDAVGFMRLRVDEAANSHNGRLFSSAGDGCMLEFSSVRQAAAFGLQLVEAFRANPQFPPVRVGVHFGEVQSGERNDLLGHTVNVAARIQGLANPNSVLASEEVARQLIANPNLLVRPAGRRRLDKMKTSTRTFEILPIAHAHSKRPNIWKRREILVGGGLVAASSLVALTLLAPKTPIIPVLAAFPLDPPENASLEERSLASGASRRLAEHMTAAKDILLIGEESLGVVDDMPKRDAAVQLGANLGFSGRFASSGARYAIEASLWRVKPPLVVFARTISGDLRNLESDLRELSTEIVASSGGQQAQLPSVFRPSDSAMAAVLDDASALLREDSIEALDQARAQFTRVSELAPLNARAFRGLGASWLALSARAPDPDLKAKRLAEAEFCVRRALFLQPGSGEAQAQLAEVQAEAAHWRESWSAAEAALQMEPGNGLVHHHVATVYAKSGFVGRSFTHAARARTSDPFSPRIFRDWALIGILDGRAGEVQQVLDGRSPHLAQLSGSWIKALAYAEQGRFQQAVAVADDAAASTGFRSWIEAGAMIERGGGPQPLSSSPTSPADWPFWLAEATLVGRIDDAGRGLESCLQVSDGAATLRFIPVEWLFLPSLKTLRSTQACHKIFVRIGLDAFWRQHGQPDFRL